MTQQEPSVPSITGYRLIKVIGRGDTSTVYLAESESDGGRVAIKVMPTPPDADPEWSSRFLREVSILKNFDHSHIVKVIEAGEHRGNHFLVTEYLDHGSLSTWIKQGLQPPDALKLLRALALAVDYSHKHGYIHRNITPDNVLFRADGSAVLTNFGIAQQRQPNVRQVKAGAIVGTPRYMSPEQHRGLAADPRSDIYALGIIFFEMLTREVPFDGADSMSIGIKHISEALPRLPARLARFQRLLDNMLAKNPKDRIDSGETLVKAIDLLLTQPEPLAKRAIAADDALKRGVDVRESTTKAGLFSKACDISICIGADDYQTLQQHCAKAMSTLIEWHEEKGKKARGITLDFYVHPWILALTHDFVRKLPDTDGLDFLTSLTTKVRIHDLDGVLEKEVDLNLASSE